MALVYVHKRVHGELAVFHTVVLSDGEQSKQTKPNTGTTTTTTTLVSAICLFEQPLACRASTSSLTYTARPHATLFCRRVDARTH